jgi:hypothetical protein
MDRQRACIGRRSAKVGVVIVLFLLVAIERPRSQATADQGLGGVFSVGAALQDTNGDATVDAVAARILVAPDAPAADVAAAANIAARFGFETMAMNLPIAGLAGASMPAGTRLVVLVGRGNPTVAQLVKAGAVNLTGLGPGDGVVAYVAAADSTVGADAVVVAGADDAGTIAVSEALAGRAPYLWAVGGATFEKLEQDLRAFLGSSNATPDRVLVSAATVTRNRQEWVTVAVRAAFPSAASAAAARTALQRLAAAHTAGSEGQTLSYPGVGTIDVGLSAPGAAGSRVRIARVGAGVETPLQRRAGSGGSRSADLSNIYAIGGLLGDSQNDLIPDRTDTVIVPSGADEALGAVDVAARLGLESTGIRVPLARTAADIEDPSGGPTPILIGRNNPLVQRLITEKKLDTGALQPGQGLIRMVPRAFGSSSALVVTGGDARGVARATSQLAERLPHVWERGKDRTTIDAIEDDARRFVAGRSPEGQAAHALYQLSRLAQEVRGKQLESASLGVYVEKAPAGFADFVKSEIGRTFTAAKVDVNVANIDIHSQVPVFTDEFEIASEVDDLRAIVRAKVLGAVAPPRGRRARTPAAPVTIEARLSEPPEVRRALEQELRDELAAAGATDARVTILSAYKQALSWLTEEVGPALKGKGARSITIRFAELGPPTDVKLPSMAPEDAARWQAMYSPIRWLLEAYPADELLARDLGLPLDAITFEKAPKDAPTYEVSARDGSGAEIHRATFEPTFVYRSYFDQFPNYEVVRVTTGWIRARVGDRSVADERIVTDIERFWDHYQQKTLPRIYAYTMDLFKGRPEPSAAPYFGELNVDLTLSEPDFRLGLDEEQVASLESIHEEVYFTTLHFFDLFGRYTRGQPLNYPGRIIPVMRPKADGKPGRAKITFTGKAADRPKVTLEYREQGRPPVERTLRLPKIAIERPSAVAAWVRDGRDGLERVELTIKADFAEDTRADLVRKSDEDQVDNRVLFGPQAIAIVDNLRRLHEAALFTGALVYEDLGEIAFRIEWPGGEKLETLASTGAPKPHKDLRTLAAGYRYDGRRIVHWDGPISPPEAYEMLAKMSTFPEVTPYWLGESFLGKDIWAADVMPQMTASHWSQAKATALKPTVIYSARQHANEVSSTSHTMRLIELLLTDPEYKKYLSRVNVVIHPITNPDGAQLAYDLQKITPNHMLHAGYLGALGVDATSGAGQQDPLYPEAKVRPLLRRTWLPDAFLNPHGYPSHEWVQIFSEYVSWVRSRDPGGRSWCCNRGWYTSINYPEGDRFEKHKEVALALREYIVAGINSDPKVHAMNQRNYARYRRYGYTFDPENFKLNIYKDVNVYMPPKGTRAGQGGGGEGGEGDASSPRITYISSGTEAPDETAHGEWMEIVASAGLQWDLAVLKLLYDTEFKIERREEVSQDGVSLAVFRPRPGNTPKLPSPTTTQDAKQGAGTSSRDHR